MAKNTLVKKPSGNEEKTERPEDEKKLKAIGKSIAAVVMN
jgi:hypothetical protein